MDIMGGVRLTDGRELKIITGIDDHSRYCVSAALAWRATARPVCEALLAALQRHGAPEQLLTDNGKVFTARFGRGTGEVLFDRLCREHGIRHLLTAPRSPTTTGKVERFHKTVRAEFLGKRSFASLAEAQAALDDWVAHYNSERPHQGIGMVAPAERFALAHPEPVARLTLAASHEEAETPEGPVVRAVTRRVSLQGRISLAGYPYHVGVWLAGEVVEVDLRPDGLLEIVHRGVLVVCHARRHSATVDPASRPHKERAPRVGPQHPRPQTAGRPVLRMVDKRGAISFAGTTYRVGVAQARQQVEVRVVGDTVQISQQGRLVRTHAARHDRSKEHGAFATPAGRPRRPKVSQEGVTGVTELLEPICNAGTGTRHNKRPRRPKHGGDTRRAAAVARHEAAAARATTPAAPSPPGGGYSPSGWAQALLGDLGMPRSAQNVTAITAWEMAEGGNWFNSARYNPLDTTMPEPGSTAMNSAGVQAYTSWGQGLAATVATLTNGQYGGILAALRAGTSALAVSAAVSESPWGTGAFGV